MGKSPAEKATTAYRPIVRNNREEHNKVQKIRCELANAHETLDRFGSGLQ